MSKELNRISRTIISRNLGNNAIAADDMRALAMFLDLLIEI